MRVWAAWASVIVVMLGLLTFTAYELYQQREARDRAAVRIQACVVRMLMIHPDDREDMTVVELDRLCPGVRGLLEDDG